MGKKREREGKEGRRAEKESPYNKSRQLHARLTFSKTNLCLKRLLLNGESPFETG